MDESRPPIPVLVIAGYLGAGKTTLVNHLLSTATSRIAVIVNDFGSINIDAELIAQRHEDTIELTNGCVCCVITESLSLALFTIAERPTQPDLVIIEASGVADPSVVATYAHLSGFHLSGVLVLVDALNARITSLDELVGLTFSRQVRTADLIAITKTDVATDEQIRTTRQLLSDLAPQTPLVSADTVSITSLLDVTHHISDTPSTPLQHPFTTTVLDTSSLSTHTELQGLLNSLPVSTIRVKGVINLADNMRVLVQRVGLYASITPTDMPPTGLVAIHAE
jgi:G3E family GTPase